MNSNFKKIKKVEELQEIEGGRSVDRDKISKRDEKRRCLPYFPTRYPKRPNFCSW